MQFRTNLNIVKKAWDRRSESLDQAMEGLQRDLTAAAIQLAQNEIRGRRMPGERATPGAPPKNRTGTLRRSIRGEKTKRGFADYKAVVGPTVVYGRAVELGGARNWPSGLRFPYMAPAYGKLRLVARQMIASNLGRWSK